MKFSPESVAVIPTKREDLKQDPSAVLSYFGSSGSKASIRAEISCRHLLGCDLLLLEDDCRDVRVRWRGGGST